MGGPDGGLDTAGSYAALAEYYDAIMTSGYYDYARYARALATELADGTDQPVDGTDVLELGVGTGLVCEALLDLVPASVRLTGIDHTAAMLARARARSGLRGRVRLLAQDILAPDLPGGFAAAYSVGGIWLFLRDRDGLRLGSHLPDDEDNVKGLENLAEVLRPGGCLLLAVQDAHRPFRRPLPGGLVYAQDVRDHGNGRITKDYCVLRDDTVLAHQRSVYRLYAEDDANRLLERCRFARAGTDPDGLFRRYVRT
ncbi:class I SAM-dependent methyltransferase [Streptomyces venezuelae]|nr:class I SAM-dependent methyltransferase [Streptomyces venezuelae]